MRYVKGSLLVVLIWYLIGLLVNSPIIPLPHDVFIYLIQHHTTSHLSSHLLYSLYRIIMGLGIALFIAIPTGLLIGRKRALDEVLSPVLYLLYPLPKIAFLPVFMVMFGIGDISKIILIAVIVFFPTAVSIRDGVKAIPNQYIQLAEAYHLTPKLILREVIWPAILPRIFSAIRISLGIALSVLFISESFAASFGLGYSIMNSWIMANYTSMYAGIVLLSLLGLGLYIITDSLERIFIRYQAER